MARSDQDYIFLRRLNDILGKDTESAAQSIAEIYTVIFGDAHPPRPQWRPQIEKWEAIVVARATVLLAQIIAKYVQLFYDPRAIPVTHYWKQKQVAVFLDEQFSEILWDAIKRSSSGDERYNVYEELETDAFLDKPILFLKEEARNRVFWNLKNQAGFDAIRVRFLDKVKSSGVNLAKLEQDDLKLAQLPSDKV